MHGTDEALDRFARVGELGFDVLDGGVRRIFDCMREVVEVLADCVCRGLDSVAEVVPEGGCAVWRTQSRSVLEDVLSLQTKVGDPFWKNT